MKTYGFYKNKMLFMDYSILYDRPLLECSSEYLYNESKFIKGVRLAGEVIKLDGEQAAQMELILRN